MWTTQQRTAGRTADSMSSKCRPARQFALRSGEMRDYGWEGSGSEEEPNGQLGVSDTQAGTWTGPS